MDIKELANMSEDNSTNPLPYREYGLCGHITRRWPLEYRSIEGDENFGVHIFSLRSTQHYILNKECTLKLALDPVIQFIKGNNRNDRAVDTRIREKQTGKVKHY